MKVLCTIDFVHSGSREYRAAETYEITEDTALALSRLVKSGEKGDKKGALKYFTPVNKEAKDFFNENGFEVITEANPVDDGPKPPTRGELVKEASALGVEKANKLNTDELNAAIAAKKAEA
jgi:hypothetical protein